MTDPDWEPVMKRAAAIVTNRGGRTCHAAIIARELGVPAVVGCGDATRVLADGAEVTVCCSDGRYRPRLRRAAARRDRGRRARPDAAVADQDHDERRQSRARVRVPAAAQRGRGPRAARVHHQPQRRHPPEGAARARPPARGTEARDRDAHRRLPQPDRVLRAEDRRRRRDDRRGVLPEEGHRAAVRLQVERVLEPGRRRPLRAARGKPDAGLPRRVAIHRARVLRLLRARVRGDEARARRDGLRPTSS